MLKYTFTLHLDGELNTLVEPIINEISSRLDISADSFLRYSLHLAAWEILANIINHTDHNSGWTVHIKAWWTDKEIYLEIEHENGCFNWENCLPPALPSPEETRGRGMYLVDQISKQFSYDANGRTATIVFDRV